MSLEVIPVSEDLKLLGVTKIGKDNNNIQLIFHNQTVVIFEILQEQLLKTIENLKYVAKKESVIALQSTKLPSYYKIRRNISRFYKKPMEKLPILLTGVVMQTNNRMILMKNLPRRTVNA